MSITRWDAFKMQLFTYPRVGLNWIIFVVFWIGTASGLQHWVSVNLWAFLLVSVLTAFVAFVAFGFLYAAFFALFVAKPIGMLGLHKYSVTSASFIEVSERSRIETEWSGINSIMGNGGMVYVQIPGWRLHVVPKRAFESSAEFEEFRAYLHERVNAT